VGDDAVECTITFLYLLNAFAKFRHHSAFALGAAVGEGIEAYERVFFKKIWILCFAVVEQRGELSEPAAQSVYEEHVFGPGAQRIHRVGQAAWMVEVLWSTKAFFHGAFTIRYFEWVRRKEPAPGNLSSKCRTNALCGLRGTPHNGRNLQ